MRRAAWGGWATASLLSIAVVVTTPASAEVIEVQMLNQDPDDPSRIMVYEPDLIRAEPGDTIVFRAVDPGHNVASVEGGLPEGAEPFRGEISKDFELTVESEGTYLLKCEPHYVAGMVGLLLVGDFETNFDEARSIEHNALAQERFDQLFERAAALK